MSIWHAMAMEICNAYWTCGDGANRAVVLLVAGKVAPFRAQGSPLLPLLLVATLLALAVRNGRDLAGAGQLLGLRGVQEVALLVALALFILKLIFKYGRQMVNAPNLRPELSAPWH